MMNSPDYELRMRAAVRVARRRSFMVSLAVVGTLIVFNLWQYSQSHNRIWLYLDGVFVVTLAIRAWNAFGTQHRDEERIQREMNRMRAQGYQMQAPTVGPLAGTPSVPPPPPTQQQPGVSAGSTKTGSIDDPWGQTWNY